MLEKSFVFFNKRNSFLRIQGTPSIKIFGNDVSQKLDVSITIPTYKRAKTLSKTIDSALNQSALVSFEIIVVDNNPDRNDETEILMNGYRSNQNISYYKNSENLGMAGNWNRCVELARGEWFVLIHDDDLLAPDFLSVLCKCMLDGVDAIFPTLKTFNEDENLPLIVPKKKLSLRLVTLKDLYMFGPLSASGHCIRRNVIIDNGGYWDSGLNKVFPPDVFFTELTYYARVYVLNQEIVYYRVGLNASLTLEALDNMTLVNHYLRAQTLQKIGVPNCIIKRAMLYSDILFSETLNKVWNKSFYYSKMPSFTSAEKFVSKLIFRIMDYSLLIIRKLQRKVIIIS